MIILQHLVSNLRSSTCQVVAYERLKTVENATLNFNSESGHGCLREVVAHKRLDWETCVFLKTWSLRRGGRLREVVATGGSTVLKEF